MNNREEKDSECDRASYPQLKFHERTKDLRSVIINHWISALS